MRLTVCETQTRETRGQTTSLGTPCTTLQIGSWCSNLGLQCSIFPAFQYLNFLDLPMTQTKSHFLCICFTHLTLSVIIILWFLKPPIARNTCKLNPTLVVLRTIGPWQDLLGTRVIDGLLDRWVSRCPVDGHFLQKIISFFICCLINCSFVQAW